MTKMSGQSAVPQIVINGETVIGFNEKLLREKLGLNITPTPSQTPTPTSSSIPSSNWTYWGPATFGKDYSATPGAMINFTDMKRGTDQEGTPIMYLRPVVVGLPENEIYFLWSKKLGQSLPIKLSLFEMSITSGGYVVPKGSTSPVSVIFDSFARGEAQIIALMNADQSIIAYGKVVMYPIQANQGNSRIWVELMSLSGNVFTIYGVGFEPNEELTVTSNSEGEKIESKFKVDEGGRFMNVLLPAVVGKESGQVTYTVAGKSGTLQVSFEWGPPAILPGP
jgi:hypothetical protein